MFTPSVRIALSKSRSPGERADFFTMLERAEQLDKVESEFQSKINASKAVRGEGPTLLSKGKRAQLQHLAQDEREMASEQLITLESMPTAAAVVRVLHSGLQSDVAFWQQAPKHTHAADLHVVQEFIEAKASLLESLTAFLARHPENDA
jgi:hypothetical protein